MKEKEMPKKKKVEEKDGEKKDNPVKKIKPLAEKLMAVSAAVIITACTTTFNAKDSDAQHDSIDSGEVAEVSGDVPPVDMPVDTVHDEAPVDGHDEDGVISCEPFSESLNGLIDREMTMEVGGIEVRYDGMSGENEGEYSILCGGEVVAGDTVPAGESRSISVPEHSFDAEIRADMVRETNTRVNITVSPY